MDDSAAENVSFSLRRTISTTDFSKLLEKSTAHTPTISRSAIESHDDDSDTTSQVLYMKPSRPRPIKRTLSSRSNGSCHIMDGSSDGKPVPHRGGADESLSWSIIDREISEWQYVCQTGRPYWWSPESKYFRLKLHPLGNNEPSSRIWLREFAEQPSHPASESHRRAVSESCLPDPSKTHDLAHIIAVQLLGSCFTLPPDHVVGSPAPHYTVFDETGATILDPRMISSLRMHTQFRYSPSFGHQARNTSPVQSWPSLFDGTSHTSSPESFGLGWSDYLSRKRVQKRYTKRSRQQSTHSGDEDSPLLKRDGSPDSPSSNKMRKGDEIKQGEYRGVQTHIPKSNYRLQPIIRSEPHPVYIQPVKELVVKRWRTLRRRFGGSLYAEQASEDQSISEQERADIAVASTDAKRRRRMARERGEIHSSADSTVHYNSPVSGVVSPDRSGPVTPTWTLDSRDTSPNFQLADPLSAAASLVAAESNTSRGRPRPRANRNNSPTSTASNKPGLWNRTATPEHTGLWSPAPLPEQPNNTPVSDFSPLSSSAPVPSSLSPETSTSGNLPQRSDSTHFNPIKQPVQSSAHSFASKRQSRKRRKSMLSEVFTPEDLQLEVAVVERDGDRSILSALGSTLATPKEETEPISPLKLPHRWLDVNELGGQSPESVPTVNPNITSTERPQLSRISTSGSQIFTPSFDGMEVDGLPVGPSKAVWDHDGSRGGRSHL